MHRINSETFPHANKPNTRASVCWAAAGAILGCAVSLYENKGSFLTTGIHSVIGGLIGLSVPVSFDLLVQEIRLRKIVDQINSELFENGIDKVQLRIVDKTMLGWYVSTS